MGKVLPCGGMESPLFYSVVRVFAMRPGNLHNLAGLHPLFAHVVKKATDAKGEVAEPLAVGPSAISEVKGDFDPTIKSERFQQRSAFLTLSE
jgi:hypothetical protein